MATLVSGLRFGVSAAIGIYVFSAFTTAPSSAQDFKFNFKGSLADGQHTRYVPPLANPLFNETPYITTEIRPLYLYTELPDDFLTSGGNIHIVAAEIRVALTDRLGIIATSDGFADANFDAVLPDDNGFVNLSLGFKYAIHSDPKDQSILSIGVEYEAPTGTVETGGISLEGDGDGFVDIFVTGAKAYGKLGLQGSAGVNIAVDRDHNSSMVHYSAHADYEIAPNFFPMIELNGYTVVDEATRTAVNFEGLDLINFGSTRAGTVVTLGLGARYRFNDNVQLGAGYERPITDREDIIDWRINFDLVISY